MRQRTSQRHARHPLACRCHCHQPHCRAGCCVCVRCAYGVRTGFRRVQVSVLGLGFWGYAFACLVSPEAAGFERKGLIMWPPLVPFPAAECYCGILSGHGFDHLLHAMHLTQLALIAIPHVPELRCGVVGEVRVVRRVDALHRRRQLRRQLPTRMMLRRRLKSTHQSHTHTHPPPLQASSRHGHVAVAASCVLRPSAPQALKFREVSDALWYQLLLACR